MERKTSLAALAIVGISTGLLSLGAALPATAATTQDSTTGAGSCWQELAPGGGTSSDEICVDGNEAALAKKVLDQTGKVIVDGAATPQTVSRARTQVAAPASAQATYVLGEVYELANYKGYSKYWTTSHSGGCNGYIYKVPSLGSEHWGGSLMVQMNDQISAVQPGPGCYINLYVDASLKGSVWSTKTDKATISWMDDKASSISFTSKI